MLADVSQQKAVLPRLPDTASELKEVAASVQTDLADVIVGAAATVTRVKQEKLDQFRIVYFATHGLLAGDVTDFAKLKAEPALVLSLPDHPTEFDDGLLTASEETQLKFNADWVVLSGCNTASVIIAVFATFCACLLSTPSHHEERRQKLRWPPSLSAPHLLSGVPQKSMQAGQNRAFLSEVALTRAAAADQWHVLSNCLSSGVLRSASNFNSRNGSFAAGSKRKAIPM